MPDLPAATASAAVARINGIPGVEVPGERGECGEQYRGGYQDPGELAGDAVAGEQAAFGGDQVALPLAWPFHRPGNWPRVRRAATGRCCAGCRGHPAAHGWGTAMSTDSAFALGTLAVTGQGSPTGCARCCCRSRSWMTWFP
jgi:hypothetical protein